MKRKLLLLASMAICGTSMAQNRIGGGRTFTYLPTVSDQSESVDRSGSVLRGGGQTILWAEDFAGGVNNAGSGVTTTMGTWTAANTNGNIWKHSTSGPEGCFSNNLNAPATFTTANGFLLFDGDSANCVDASTNPPTFDQNEWVGSIVSPVIDLSASPDVVVDFEYNTRWCCSTQAITVAFSTNGTTWSAEFPMVSPAANTVVTDNFTMNASSLIGGSATAQMRITWGSPSHYFLMVDDVTLFVPNADDVIMNFAYESFNASAEEYARVPLNQLEGELLVGAEVFNFGVNDQTNVNMTYTITNNATSTQLTTGTVNAPADLASGDTISLEELADISTAVIGKYTIDYEVQSDNDQVGGSTGTNNSASRFLEVTNDIYAIDGLGNYGAGLQNTASLGTASFTDAADGFMILNFYDIKVETYALGLEVVLRTGTNGSVAGGALVAAIHDTVNVFVDNVTDPLGQSDIYDVTASDISGAVSNAATITIPFLDPILLAPNAYFAGIEMFSNAEVNNVVVVDDITVPQPSYSSMIFVPNDAVYSNGNAMAVRLITSPSIIGISEVAGLGKLVAYPNPASDVLNVSITSTTDQNASIRISTIDGRVLSTRSVKSGMATNRQSFDISGFANGVYLVQLVGTNGVQTTKFNVIH